jgi:hypothetical protein
MGEILCFFFRCRWRHVVSVAEPDENGEPQYLTGIYQCSRCRLISIGSPRLGNKGAPNE